MDCGEGVSPGTGRAKQGEATRASAKVDAMERRTLSASERDGESDEDDAQDDH